jgi:putative DNA primase/helicase
MTAENIAKALRGHKIGSGWIARCPAHDDRTPSLSLRDGNDGKVLVRCHAGCEQDKVISTLRLSGLWPDKSTRLFRQATARKITERAELDHSEGKRTEAALKLWQSAQSSDGTLVETYFQSRGLHLPPPPTLRFISVLKHPSGGSWPAMIALVTRGSDGSSIAIHRTYLARDGAGKAPVEPQKMMLGPCRGGVVRLAEPGDVLMIGEGIETSLAVMQQTGQPAWAALSTSGLRTLDLPQGVSDVIVLADGDDPGEAAAKDCAIRWKREGRRVRIARPQKGMDFNDMLRRLSIAEGEQ